ncbi:hypothetical protein M2M59_12530 [Rummeliibacillus sp. G93]|uniref:hypothetical protein n=1 Tax=Rummeliibacillus sp. G93 TaxID=2939494 RepID=UPI00201BC89A|nr:hypothetical protein [Rummeliibacillus sp. G93]UQW96784.1 hypothetical protein M2M59_12530 [Rummeliibacillus sp. G93]
MGTKDYFKNLLKIVCEDENLPLQKVKYTRTDNNVYISIRNNIKGDVELDVIEILSNLLHILVPLKIDFTHYYTLYPHKKGLDEFVIVFKKEDYLNLNLKLETGDF